MTRLMRTRGRRIVTILLVLAGLTAAAYAAAPTLLAMIASRALSGTLEVRRLEIEAIGLNRIEAARVDVNNRQMRIEAQRAVVRFNTWPLQITGVDIARARVTLSGTGAEGGTTGAPAPGFPVRIDALELSVPAPWGRVSLPLSVHARPGAAAGYQVDIDGPDFSARLSNPEAGRHQLAVTGDAGPILSLDFATQGSGPKELSGSVQPTGLKQWLASSAVPPGWLKSAAAPYVAAGGELAFDIRVGKGPDFAAEVRGVLTLRDRRAEGERLFDELSLDTGEGYSVSRTGNTWSGSGPAALALAFDGETRIAARAPAWRWDTEGLRVQASGLALAPSGLSAESIEASAGLPNNGTIEGSLALEGVGIPAWPEAFPAYRASGQWAWHGGELEAGGVGRAPALPELDWRVSLSGDTGSVGINAAAPVARLQQTLALYTSAVADELNVHGGALDGRYLLQWNGEQERSSLELNARAVDADLDEMELRGLEVRAAGEHALETITVAVSAPSLKLAAGTVAEALDLRLLVQPPVLRVERARARLFGGLISVRPVAINLDEQTSTLFADIDELSLERIMAIFELQTTELTGTVSGPVRIVYDRQRGLAIDEARLRGTRPGVLRFSLSGDPEVAAGLDNIAVRALEDFQYEELSAGVLYRPDGQYRIEARLVGKNPGVLDGHPIALNPTIEGRLPALFRAFFITGDFNQAIIERLRDESSASTGTPTPAFGGD